MMYTNNLSKSKSKKLKLFLIQIYFSCLQLLAQQHANAKLHSDTLAEPTCVLVLLKCYWAFYLFIYFYHAI